jgi:hypothetical protein
MSQIHKKQDFGMRNTTTILNPDGAKKQKTERVSPVVGICASCMNASECTYPKDPGRPALFCDEFAGSPGRPALKATPKNAVMAEPEQKPNLNHGLCGTCANYKECTFPKPEGGVWRCEEYC